VVISVASSIALAQLPAACFVRDADPEFRFASYDRRMLSCAGALDLAVVALD
jgi:hypothetical protein